MSPLTWREEPYDSQFGQTLFYLLAVQLRSVCFMTYPPPEMGIFIADGNVMGYLRVSYYHICMYLPLFLPSYMYIVLHSCGYCREN